MSKVKLEERVKYEMQNELTQRQQMIVATMTGKSNKKNKNAIPDSIWLLQFMTAQKKIKVLHWTLIFWAYEIAQEMCIIQKINF